MATIDLRDIHSLTDFQRNAKRYVQKANKTGQPLVLTINGRPGVVVQDAQTYQEMLNRLADLQTLEAILQGHKEFEDGKGIPWEQAEAELRQEIGIHDRSIAKGKARARASTRVDGQKLVGQRRRHGS